MNLSSVPGGLEALWKRNVCKNDFAAHANRNFAHLILPKASEWHPKARKRVYWGGHN